MSYDFSFDKKSAILVVVGCLAIGVLLFFAGYIVGLDRGENQTVQANSASQNGQPPKNKHTAPAEKDASPSAEKPLAVVAAPRAAPKEAQQNPAASAADSKPPAAAGDKSQPAKDAAADKDKDKDTFSLQLGAFQTEANAQKLRDNFRAKGYPVFLFRVQDANGNLWNTVRMGHYADMKEASHAAAKMTSKEQVSAWVRPSNAF